MFHSSFLQYVHACVFDHRYFERVAFLHKLVSKSRTPTFAVRNAQRNSYRLPFMPRAQSHRKV